jgi:hypothetical protein
MAMKKSTATSWGLHDLNCSQYIIRVTKSRRMKWAGHVARMGKGEVHAGWGNLRERNHIEDVGVNERIILK